jgi:predicted nucleic acid-binding Zn finger protein
MSQAEDELELIDHVCQKSKSEGKLLGSDMFELWKTFDQRLTKAFEAVKSERVVLHLFSPSGRKLWTVKGEHGDYVILPKAIFCSCNDFYFQIQKKMKVHLCSHLIAQKMAFVFNMYTKIEHADGEYEQVIGPPKLGKETKTLNDETT